VLTFNEILPLCNGAGRPGLFNFLQAMEMKYCHSEWRREGLGYQIPPGNLRASEVGES